jgi:tetratricopeptide (TPR) repeat protein
VSISVNAVADVWYTILSPSNIVPSVPEGSLREYAIQGCAFYARRGNMEETRNGIRKLSELISFTDEMSIRVGDILMNYGMEELAIEQYKNAVLLNPNRKDISRKIADYYVKKSQELLKEKKLEEALEWAKNAVSADPLHPDAERLRLEIEKEVKEKEGDKEGVKKEKRFMVNACGCGKPIRPTENKEKGIITSMMVKAQDLETVLVTVEELSKKVADLEVKVEEVKAALAELTARIEKVEAVSEDVPQTLEAHKKYMQDLSAEIDKTLVQQISALSDVIKQFTPAISKLSKNI